MDSYIELTDQLTQKTYGNIKLRNDQRWVDLEMIKPDDPKKDDHGRCRDRDRRRLVESSGVRARSERGMFSGRAGCLSGVPSPRRIFDRRDRTK